MVKHSTQLLVLLLTANQLFAQTVSVPISTMLPPPYGSSSYTYPNGLVASAEIITTCSCTPGASTGKNATVPGTVIGGSYTGITIPGYTGDTAKSMLTAMQVAGTAFNGTSDGTISRPGTGSGNLSGALGFWVHFSDSVLINNVLAFDIDGTTAGNPNREWISVFGYNTKDTSAPIMFTATGGSKTSDAAMLALTSSWGTRVKAKVPAIPNSLLPNASNVQIRRSAFTGPAGTADASLDDTANQVLFNPSGGRMITDLFILWGLFDDFGGLASTQAASIGPIVAQILVPLPIRLKSFSGRIENNHAALYWNTAEEDHNERFEIQRSPDGAAFTTIDVISAAREAQNNYTFLDKNDPIQGDHFYRLKILQGNGTYTYSNTLHLFTEGILTAITISPNPVTGLATLNLDNLEGPAHISIYDAQGKVLQQFAHTAKGALKIDCTAWQPATYFVDISMANGLHRTIPFIKN